MNRIRITVLGAGLAAWLGAGIPAMAQWPVSGQMLVKNSQSGTGIPGAKVLDHWGEVTTDGNGRFLTLMYPGETYLASANGYSSAQKNLTVTECATRYAEIPLSPVGQEHLIMAAPLFGLLAGVGAYRRKLSSGL